MTFIGRLATPLPLGLVLIGTSALAPARQATSSFQNGDFEEGVLSAVPKGWFVPAPSLGAGYAARLTEDGPKSGKRCACLSYEGSVQPPEAFGNLMQAIDATPFRGKRFVARSWVRTERKRSALESSSHAQLWVRVDRGGARMGFFDNMGDRPIDTLDWREFEISGEVAPDATAINFGIMLLGDGRAWIDGFQFEILSAEAGAIAPPRALEGRALENLVALARLIGYVRYFHPSDGSLAADWDQLAVAEIPRVEPMNDDESLARALGEVIHPIAPTVMVFASAKEPATSASVALPADSSSLAVVALEHHGVSFGTPNPIYHRKVLREAAPEGKIPPGFSDPRAPFAANLGGGVSCLVPLSVFADDQGTLPRIAPPDSPSPRHVATGNDRSTRLAAVMLSWNVFQHFYPYFDVVQADWPGALRRALTRAATDRDEGAFLDTLRCLVAELKDGHGGVQHPSDSSTFIAPVGWDWIEGKLVITRVLPSAIGVERIVPGDVIERIDGRPALDVIRDHEERVSGATSQFRRFVAVRRLALGEKRSSIALDVRRGSGEPYSVTLKRTIAATDSSLKANRPTNLSEIRDGIRYVNLDQVTEAEFQRAIPDLEKARGVIFDLRGYPSRIGPVFLQHLTDAPIQSARWMVPIVRLPDREQWAFDESGRWTLPPAAPRLKGKVAFVTDARAISYAETCLAIVEAYKLGAIVGGPTAGTNGNVNPFAVPGNYAISWTGMKVLKHDGSPHHGVGIRPTVPVEPTIRGVAEGRDELLEAAIEIVSRD